jgi:hypothetical protein
MLTILERQERRKITQKKYREKNAEKIKEADKKYRATHQKEAALYNKKRRLENPERHNTWQKKWASENPEKVAAIARKWQKSHIDKVRLIQRIASAKRRALKKAVDKYAKADLELIRLIYINCPKGYDVDHIIPLSKGGVHHPDNLQYLPSIINGQKYNKVDFDCYKYIIRWQSFIEDEKFKEVMVC